MDKKPTYEELVQRIKNLEDQTICQNTSKRQSVNTEAMSRLILENISDTIILTDDLGNMLYVCPNTTVIFGYSQDEIYAQKTIQNFLHGSVCDISEIKRKGEIKNIERSIKRSFGEERYLLINAKSVNIEGGTILYVIHDITDQKFADKNVEKYKNIVSSTIDGIAFLDKNYRYIIVNEAYENFSGVDRAEFIGKTVSEYLGEDIFKKYIKDNFDRSLQGEIVRYQEWFEYPTLGRRFVDITYSPYRESDNRITGIIASTRDITDHKKSEEALIKSESKYRDLFEANQDAITIFKIDSGGGATQFLDFNEAALKLGGYSREEMRCLNPNDFEIGVSENDIKERLAEIESKGHAYFETLLINKNGETIPVEIKMRKILFEDSPAMMNVARDISRRKIAESALKESELRYRTLANSGTALVWRSGKDKLCNYFNEPWLQFTGRTLEQELGDGWTKGVHQDDFDHCIKTYVAAFDNQEKFSMEYRLRHASGEYRWILDEGSPFYDSKGQFAGYLGHCFDITARKQSEDELKESFARIKFLADIIEKAEQPIGTGYPDGRLGFCNRAFCDLTGYSIEELQSMDWAKELTPPEWLASERQALNKLQQTRKPVKYEKECIRKNGSRVPVKMLVHIGRDQTDKADYFYTFATDLTDRKTRERESLILRTAIDQAPVGIALADEEINIYYCNPEGLGMRGGQKNDLVGIPKDAFANWQILKTNGKPYEVGNLPLLRAITKGESVREDFIVRHQDGSNRICDASAYPIYENGTIIGGMVIFLDITERIQAEEELNRIFELSPDLIGVGNLTEGYYKRVNPAYEIFGRPLEEFLSRPYMDFIHPDDHNATANVVGVMQSGKAISGFINRYRCKDGSYRSIEWRATSTQEDGTVHVAGRDITDRLKAEKNLKESEEKYRELFNSIRDAILVTDINRSIIDCNSAFTELFGYSIDEIKGKKTLFIYENEKQFQELGKSLQKRYGQSPFLKTVNYRKKNGEAFSGETGVFFLKDQEGEITGFIGLIRDVTERKKLELQVRQAQKMESIGTLAGGIAHEFNNMLAIIIGNNELIMEEVSQSSLAKESAEEIRIAGLRARDVVKQLLTFSRQDDTIQKVMDLKLVVEESMRLIRSSTPANIKIEQHLLPNTCLVLGNETQINQLLINLCNNAVDVLPEKGGIITIELLNEIVDNRQTKHQVKLRPGKYAKLKVNDNGFGMDNDILDRIFDPYFTTKDIGQGTGIGMAVVHGIVEKHGGAITVDSSPGRGSTFTIFLPVHDGLTEQNIDEQNILPVGGEHILYVDDEPAIAKLGKRLLESLGYITESVCDPEEALDMVRSDPYKFDLLVTDMAMPNMTGDQLVAEILKIRQDMPTIICTGYSAKISEKEATDIGVQSFLMKPINKSELAKTVRKVLDDAKNSNLVGQ